MLREQLDQANSANQALSEDIRRVTSDWTRSCKELEQREATWRREEEVSRAWRESLTRQRGVLAAVQSSLERDREPDQSGPGPPGSWPWSHMLWARLASSSIPREV